MLFLISFFAVSQKMIYFAVVICAEIMEEIKKPYKITEKVDKEASYRTQISAELADELYDKILTIIIAQKKYRDPEYSAKQLAKDLNTNARYLSGVINSRFGMDYSCLVNEHRVRDAANMLVDKRYADKTMEEIGFMAGFANRQSFYASFYKYKGCAPHKYKKGHQK